MHDCTDRETLIYARDETREALNSLARVFVFPMRSRVTYEQLERFTKLPTKTRESDACEYQV